MDVVSERGFFVTERKEMLYLQEETKIISIEKGYIYRKKEDVSTESKNAMSEGREERLYL